MKCWHRVAGRPIGPSWEVVLTEPKPIDDEYNIFGEHWQETTLEQVTAEFNEHLAYAVEHFPNSYFPYELKVAINEEQLRKL